MYAVSATHWALVVSIAIRGLRVGEILMTPSEVLAVEYLPTINVRRSLTAQLGQVLISVKYILSDGIVLWRAWVLWDRRVTLFIPPFLFLVCTLGEHR